MTTILRSAVVLFIPIFLLNPGHAATLDVPGTYSTISAAITASASGDTIAVAAGTYVEGFTMPNNRYIIASSGRPVIRWNGTHLSVPTWMGTSVMINGGYPGTCTMIGLEIDGRNVAGTDSCNNLVGSTGNFRLYDCVLRGSKGYLARSNNGGCRAENCLFVNAGTGWYTRNNSTVRNCEFTRIGTAIFAYSATNSTWDNLVIHDCTNAVVERNTHDNVLQNCLIYRNRSGYYGTNEARLRTVFLSNTIVMNRQHGVRINGTYNSNFKNNILYFNGQADTSQYYDLSADNPGKKGWDITYNDIGRYNSNLDTTFMDSVFCIGNISADPLFADTTDSINGFYLLVNSPCIDAGNHGIRDPDSSRSDMGAYGGPDGKMKAPAWLRNLGSVVQVSGSPDILSWPQYDIPGNFDSYRIYLDKSTTSMHYQPSLATQVDAISNIATTSNTYALNADSSWYRVSVVGDSTGYLLGSGFTEHDTVMPMLTAAYYFCNGTTDPSDDELRLIFNEGLNPAGVQLDQPQNYIEVQGVGNLLGAQIISVNEFVVRMGVSSQMMAHNRSQVRVIPGTLVDYYDQPAVTQGGWVPVTTFNVVNMDNQNAMESISKAVEFAGVGAYLMVFDDGYYDEEITVDTRRLTIQADSVVNPVVQAAGNAYGFNITADDVAIVGMTVDGATNAGINFASGVNTGRTVGNTCLNNGAAGIRVSGADSIIIRGNVTRNNGNGIQVDGGVDHLVTNNQAYDNSADGIHIAGGSNVLIKNNTLYGNSDGIEAAAGSGSIINTVSLTNTVQINNAAGFTETSNFTSGTPLFTDAAARDFTYQQASPLWGGGTNGENQGHLTGRVYIKGSSTRYAFINDAYNASVDGDTLVACPGTYYEHFKLQDKTTAVIADSGTGHRWVHDEWPFYTGGSHRLVVNQQSAYQLHIRGFTFDFENANVMDDAGGWGTHEYYGIINGFGSVRNCTFLNSSMHISTYVPYVLSTGSSQRTVIDSCMFRDCGFVEMNGSGVKVISNCLFSQGGLGVTMDGNNDTLRNSVFLTGSAFIIASSGNNMVRNNLFNNADIDDRNLSGSTYNPGPSSYINNTMYNDVDGVELWGNGDILINNIIMGNDGGTYALNVNDANRNNIRGYYNDIQTTDAGTQLGGGNWNLTGGSFADPLFKDAAGGDFYLQAHSPCIDRGDLRYLDPDGGRSDMGCYGGVAADTAAPSRMDDLIVHGGASQDTLQWTWSSPAADFGYYAIYRHATSQNFAPTVAESIGAVTSSGTQIFYASHGPGDRYYKVSAVDDVNYGGGYRTYDTIPPFITEAYYYSQGTRTPADDRLVVVFNEYIADPLVSVAESVFTLYGEGDLSGAVVGTGSRVNDDTLEITNPAAMFGHNLSWLAFRTDVVYDYADNWNRTDSMLVTTYNVVNEDIPFAYDELSTAAAAAGAGHTITVLDNGLYIGAVTVPSPRVTVRSDSARVVTVSDTVTGATMTVSGDSVVLEGVRITGLGDGLSCTGSGITVKNSIAYSNTGVGFGMGTGNQLYNSTAWNNGTGVRFTGAGNVANVISSHNGGANFNLNAATAEGTNFSYSGGAANVNYGGTDLVDPGYVSTNASQRNFLSLRSSSPCINTGDSLTTVTRDILGITRPEFDKWEVGAYEVPFGGIWLHHFTVTRAPAETTAGDPIAMTVTAYDQFNNVFSTYDRPVSIAVQGALAGSLFTYTGISTDNGNGTGTIAGTDFLLGVCDLTVSYDLAYDSVTVRVADAFDSSGTSPSTMWRANALHALTILPQVSTAGTLTVRAGRTFGDNLVVTAYDVYDNIKRDFDQAVVFASSDVASGRVLPTAYTFTAADQGIHTFTGSQFRLVTAGLQDVEVRSGTIYDSLLVYVRPDSVLSDLAVTGVPSTVQAGNTFSTNVVVSAYDAYGNLMTGFRGQVTFGMAIGGTGQSLPPAYTFAAGDSGSHSFDRGLFRLTNAVNDTMIVTSGTVTERIPIAVTPGVFNRIAIEQGASGWQPGQVGGTIVTTGTVVMHASTYDAYDNYRGDTTVVWSQVAGGTLDPEASAALPDTSVSYTFDPTATSAGTEGLLMAFLTPSYRDTTDSILVREQPTSVYILTQRSGSKADSLAAVTITADDTLSLYAAGYNNVGTFMGYYQVDWTVSVTSGSFPYGGITAQQTTLRPVQPGSGTLTITLGSAAYTSGTVTIVPGAVADIRINRAAGGASAMPDTALTTDDALTMWGGAYDADGNFINDTTVTWRVTGTLDSTDLSSLSGTNTTFDGTLPGNGSVIASLGSIADTVNISVSVGAVAQVVIRDSSSGGGQEVDTFTIVAREQTLVYAAGYDADGNYVSDVDATWGSIVSEPDFTFTGSGAEYTFAPDGSGKGYLTASYPGAVSDSTGLITVLSAEPTHLQVVSVPDTVTAGTAFDDVVIWALDQRDRRTDYEAPTVLWQVLTADSVLTSLYGQTVSVPGDSQHFVDGILDTNNLQGDFTFVRAVRHAIRITVVLASGDTLPWSPVSNWITVIPSVGYRVEAADASDNLPRADSLEVGEALILTAQLHDQYGNYKYDTTGVWSSSQLEPVVNDTGITTTVSITSIGTGYLYVNAGSYWPDTVALTTKSGPAVTFDMIVIDASGDTAVLRGGNYYTKTESLFTVAVVARDVGGNVADRYSGVKDLDWTWISGDSINTVNGHAALMASDGQYTFTAGVCLVPGFRTVSLSLIRISVADTGNNLDDTLGVVGNDGSGPVMLSGYTGDRNGDGYIDVFTVFFNEDLQDTFLTGADAFSVSTGGNAIVIDSLRVYGSLRMMVLYGTNSGTGDITDEERLNQDTRAEPSVTCSGASEVTDTTYNRVDERTVVLADSAGPVVSSANYDDNGTAEVTDDVLTVRLSEPVDPSSVNGPPVSSLFEIKGIGEFGSDATVSVDASGYLVTINMGAGQAVVPSEDSVRLVPGAVRDLRGNAATPENRPWVIVMPLDALIMSVGSYPNPCVTGSSRPSGPIAYHIVADTTLNPPVREDGGIIKYVFNRDVTVELVIFSPLGVPVLKDRINPGDPGAKAGVNFYFWNGSNGRGRYVESGAYIMMLKAQNADGLKDTKTWRIGVINRRN